MPHVKIEICRFVDEAQPGWVECRLIDASGSSHIFIEKIPIVTQEDLWMDSSFPARGEIACRIVARHTVNERAVCTIDTELPWGIESTERATRFDIYAKQLNSEVVACPCCGDDLVVQATGESRCVSSGALLSINITNLLRERFSNRATAFVVAPLRYRTGGRWFCPACGVSMLNHGDRVVCEVCSRPIHDLIGELTELNPHPPAMERSADQQAAAAGTASRRG